MIKARHIRGHYINFRIMFVYLQYNNIKYLRNHQTLTVYNKNNTNSLKYI